jgi:hypothetical protein
MVDDDQAPRIRMTAIDDIAAAFAAGWIAAMRDERGDDWSPDVEDGLEIAVAFDEWKKGEPPNG